MAEAIKALAYQRRPSESRIPGLLDGLETIADRADVELAAVATAGE